MGASVNAYWPGMTEEQLANQPGFFNDDKAWGDWMAERFEHTGVLTAMKELEVAALLTFKTDGVEDDDVEWVTPDQLESAARALADFVGASDPRTSKILETYALRANEVDSVRDEFVRDLEDIASIAAFARANGAQKLTLEVNW